MEITRTARRVNDEMPSVVVDRLESELAATDADLADASVVVLGITYRPGVEETRASPAIGVIDALREAGADVAGVDPLVEPADYGARAVGIDDLPEESFDAAVVVTPHAEFDSIPWTDCDPMVVVDARDAVDLSETPHREYTLAGAADGRAPRGDAGEGAVPPDERSLTADGGIDDRTTDADADHENAGADDV